MIIQGMKKIVSTVAKTISKVAVKSTSFISKRTAVSLRSFGNRMMSNMRSAKWWAKAARFVRKSGLIGQTGNVADALNKSGASNWLTKGLSAFKYDTRSPKEYAREYEYKTNLIESLKKKRDKLIEEADKVKDELNKPTLSILNIPDPGDKINVLSASIDQMKAGLAQVKVSQAKTNALLGGVSEELTLGNVQLGEAVLKSSESNLKTSLLNAEDIKNHNMAMHQESTQNIVSDINAHIDEVEQNRKDEEAEREKNDWKRKFFLNFLLIMEWILDFPGKIKMLLIKVGLMLTLALTAIILKNWNKIMALFHAGFGAVAGMLKDMIIRNIKLLLGAITKVLSLLQDGFRWVMDKLTFGIYSKIVPDIPYENWTERLWKSAGEDTDDIDAKMEGYVAQYKADQQADKRKAESAVEAGANQIDPANPDKKVNLDVVNSAGAETTKKKKDKGTKDKDIPSAGDETKSNMDMNNLDNIMKMKNGGGADDGLWSTQASVQAQIEAIPDVDYNRKHSESAPKVNKRRDSNYDGVSPAEKDMKEIKKLMLATNENINNVNSNVIKGTSKTMKAAASRQPIQTINKIDMKKASPTINPNGI